MGACGSSPHAPDQAGCGVREWNQHPRPRRSPRVSEGVAAAVQQLGGSEQHQDQRAGEHNLKHTNALAPCARKRPAKGGAGARRRHPRRCPGTRHALGQDSANVACAELCLTANLGKEAHARAKQRAEGVEAKAAPLPPLCCRVACRLPPLRPRLWVATCTGAAGDPGRAQRPGVTCRRQRYGGQPQRRRLGAWRRRLLRRRSWGGTLGLRRTLPAAAAGPCGSTRRPCEHLRLQGERQLLGERVGVAELLREVATRGGDCGDHVNWPAAASGR